MFFSRLVRIIKGGERRKERRVALRLPAEISAHKGRITDLSLGGCGFYVDEGGALEIGDAVVAHIAPTGEEPFDVPAKIVGQDEEGMVYCVAFTEVAPDNFERLQELIVRQALGAKEDEDEEAAGEDARRR